MVSHFVLSQEVGVFFGRKGPSEREYQILQDVDRSLSIKQEDALAEQLPLFLALFLLNGQQLHLRRLLELLRYLILL